MNIIATKINEKRYIIVDKNTGEILADNCKFGYSSKQSAYEAFAKHKTTKPVIHKIDKKIIIDWCKKNKGIIKTFFYSLKDYDEITYEHEKALLQIIFREFKIDESYLEFGIDDLLKILNKKVNCIE